MPATQTNTVTYLDETAPISIIGATAFDRVNNRVQGLAVNSTDPVSFAHVECLINGIRLYIDSSLGVTHYANQDVTVYYIQE